jgi:hypothetical protein
VCVYILAVCVYIVAVCVYIFAAHTGIPTTQQYHSWQLRFRALAKRCYCRLRSLLHSSQQTPITARSCTRCACTQSCARGACTQSCTAMHTIMHKRKVVCVCVWFEDSVVVALRQLTHPKAHTHRVISHPTSMYANTSQGTHTQSSSPPYKHVR